MDRTANMKTLWICLLVCTFLQLNKVESEECYPYAFECSNGRCTSFSDLCDYGNDCRDMSDEQVCEPFDCHRLAFQCSNGKCITRRWLCNGVDNCGDNSDEEMCDPFACHPTSFQCLNGKCMSRNNFCDRDTHCGDNSDEKYCDVTDPAQCPRNWTLCPNGGKCIPARWVCNGYPDCPFGSDELNCDPFPFQCPNGKNLSRRFICDGRNGCGDKSDEKVCVPFACHPSAFQCSNGKCIPRHSFCNRTENCGDNSDEGYCDVRDSGLCPRGWTLCPNGRRCIPAHWECDGLPDCHDGAEEKNCDNSATKAELKSRLLSRRKPNSGSDRWGSQVHRIAVALHLADNSPFGTGQGMGEEIRYELTNQLLRRLGKDKRMSSQELALYIQALLVSCVDPRDFYGDNLVMELRRRVETSGNFTNPSLILALCNAGDGMTERDVQRLRAGFNSLHRPFWTDYQALSTMALSCIFSRSGGSVDERVLKDMLQELKRHQFRNGTVDNYRTTALVTQALFIHNSYEKDFDLDSALKVLTDGLKGNRSLLDAYYAFPVFHRKSLLNVTSDHCPKEPEVERKEKTEIKEQKQTKEEKEEEEEALQKTLDVLGETMGVRYSVWMGDDVNLARTWRLRVRANSTIYDVIETVAKIDNRQKVEYNVVDGKPFVAALNGKEDDPQMGLLWFVYLHSLDSDKDPKMVNQSPVDVKLQPKQEIILWYRRGPWSENNPSRKPETSP